MAALALVLFVTADQMNFFDKMFEEKAPAFPQLTAGTLAALEIENTSGTVRVENRDGRWWVTQPFDDAAHPDVMAEFLNALSGLRAGRYVSSAEMKAEGNVFQSYGFMEGKELKLTLEESGAEEPVVLLVGAAAEIPGSAYCRVREPVEIGGVFTVSGSLRSFLERPPDAFLDPRLLRFEPLTVERVQIFQGDTGITLEKAAQTGNWRLTTPLAVRADTERVDDLLNALAVASISNVATPAEAEVIAAEGGTVQTTLHLFLSGSEKPVEVELIPGPADAGTVYARTSRRPRLYETDVDLLTSFSPQPNFWRDRRLLRLEMADVEKLTILSGGMERVALEQLGTVWMFDGEGEQAGELVNARQVEALFTTLNEATVVNYVSDSAAEHADYGLVDPLMTWQFEGSGIVGSEENGGRIVMKIGKVGKNERTVFVNFEGEPFVFEVSSTFYHALSPLADPVRWRSLEVLNIAFEAMREIRIMRREDKTLRLALDFVNASSSPEKAMRLWENGAEVGADLDRKQASQLIVRLGVLEAAQWVKESRDALAMLSLPDLTLEIDFLHPQALEAANAEASQGLETVKLIFAPTSRGGGTAYYYGQVEGEDDVFLIAERLFRTLSGEGLILR